MDLRILEFVDFVWIECKLFLELYLSMLLQFPEAKPVLIAQFVSYSDNVATVHEIEPIYVVRQL